MEAGEALENGGDELIWYVGTSTNTVRLDHINHDIWSIIPYTEYVLVRSNAVLIGRVEIE